MSALLKKTVNIGSFEDNVAKGKVHKWNTQGDQVAKKSDFDKNTTGLISIIQDGFVKQKENINLAIGNIEDFKKGMGVTNG